MLHHRLEDPIQQAHRDRVRGGDQALDAVAVGGHPSLRQKVQGGVREGVAVLVEDIIST